MRLFDSILRLFSGPPSQREPQRRPGLPTQRMLMTSAEQDLMFRKGINKVLTPREQRKFDRIRNNKLSVDKRVSVDTMDSLEFDPSTRST